VAIMVIMISLSWRILTKEKNISLKIIET